MNIRFAAGPKRSDEIRQLDTEQLRENSLVTSLMQDDTVQMVYTHYDKVIIGGAKPVTKSSKLTQSSRTES